MTGLGLWHDHEATPRQQRLAFGRSKHRGKITQADLLIAMLREARNQGGALGLPALMQAGIAQHSARIVELRKRGFVIENELERSIDGRVLSWYWLRHDPGREGRRP